LSTSPLISGLLCKNISSWSL